MEYLECWHIFIKRHKEVSVHKNILHDPHITEKFISCGDGSQSPQLKCLMSGGDLLPLDQSGWPGGSYPQPRRTGNCGTCEYTSCVRPDNSQGGDWRSPSPVQDQGLVGAATDCHLTNTKYKQMKLCCNKRWLTISEKIKTTKIYDNLPMVELLICFCSS